MNIGRNRREYLLCREGIRGRWLVLGVLFLFALAMQNRIPVDLLVFVIDDLVGLSAYFVSKLQTLHIRAYFYYCACKTIAQHLRMFHQKSTVVLVEIERG